MEITEKENYRIGLMIQTPERQWEFQEAPLYQAFAGSFVNIVESFRSDDKEMIDRSIFSLAEHSMNYPQLIFAVEQCKVVSISMEIDGEPMDTEIEIVFRRDTFCQGLNRVAYPYRLAHADLSVFAE